MKEQFSERLAQLRMAKGVSARDMSLSLGQSAGYINNIENKNNLPSMTLFFYICEYLDISPMEFFNYEIDNPCKIDEIIEDLKKLDIEKLNDIGKVIKHLAKK